MCRLVAEVLRRTWVAIGLPSSFDTQTLGQQFLYVRDTSRSFLISVGGSEEGHGFECTAVFT